MNESLAEYTLHGRVVDVGGGRHPDYFMYLKRSADVSVEVVDGSLAKIDLEKDLLPHGAHSFDMALACNLLEHIYNHQFLLKEIHRVLVPRGMLIGVVPFWTGYHPDSHDYFRYTHEALARMLTDAEFTDISIQRFGGGPLLANFNTIVLSLPRLIRPLAYCAYAALDAVFLLFRPRSAERNPLFYRFSAYA